MGDRDLGRYFKKGDIFAEQNYGVLGDIIAER